MKHTTKTALFLFLSSLCPLCLCGSASAAALDPEVKKPYQLHVVLRVAPHRLLTQVFKDQLRRELRDSLQAALGAMGTVEVVEEHPLLKDIETRGLQPILDGFDKSKDAVAPVKTHFVLVDFVDNQYEVQAGQHDGLTGLASPVVRKARSDDRQLVAKLAALLVERDFGIVGTVAKKEGQKVELILKGSQLDMKPARWVKKGDIFAIARIGKGRATRVPEAFLQATETPKDGTVVCRLFNRYADDDSRLIDGKNGLGFRCLKLGTSDAALRLRFVDATGLPQDNLRIEVGRQGFDKNDEFTPQGTTRSEGLIQTADKYQNIAFVRVTHSSKVIAQVPVPIFDERIAVCRVNITEQGDVLAQLIANKKRLLERLNEALLVQDDLRKELGELMAKSQREEALDKARSGLKGLKDDVTSLRAEKVNLDAQAPAGTKFSSADCEQRLLALEKAREELDKYAVDLNEIITKLKNDTSAQTLKGLILRANGLVKEANFDEAIKVYDEALDKGGNDRLRQEVADLKEGWRLKDAEHGKARHFIYDVWPKLDTAQKIKDKLPEVRRALALCKDKGDKLTPVKLLQANVAHDARLNQELKKLRRENEDDRRTIEIIEKVGLALEELHKEAVEYVNSGKPAAK